MLDIIDGEKYIPFQRIKDGKFIFDYKVIEERKLNLSAFPLDSVFVNIHDQMQKNRRGVLFGMIGVAVSLFIFIAVSFDSYNFASKRFVRASSFKLKNGIYAWA